MGDRYCYHCRLYHPENEMEQVDSKSGKRWRCKKSLAGGRKSQKERDVFGKSVTAQNSRQAKLRREYGQSE